jgi:glycosyltransferase 2 family protein
MDENNGPLAEPKKKKSPSKKYVISISIVLVMTVLSLLFSLYSAGEGDMVAGADLIWRALTGCNPWWLVCIGLLVFLSYVLDGVIIQVFCRLYTRHYYFHQGVSNAMIGAFYSAVTPGASGGQVMQVYTMKKQGIEISNAASIMVMWFIIYQLALIIFDIVSIILEWGTISSITSFTIPGFQLGSWNGEISMLPLIVLGFGINLSVIIILFLMSYSHRFHNFIMHYGIGFFSKIHLIKNPDKSRENLRVQVENFKIELKRLQANVPVTVLIFLLFSVIIVIRFSIPYFAGLALDAYGIEEGFSISRLFDACFKSAFQQMVVGIFPLPGSAGVSELFFAAMFSDFFVETQSLSSTGLVITRTASANMAAAQILWRTATFHLLVIVSGFFAALYHSRPHEDYHYANRQTYVDLQLETFDERKKSADTLYETKQLSRKEIQKRMQGFNGWGQETGDDLFSDQGENRKKKNDPKKGDKDPKKDWDSIDVN